MTPDEQKHYSKGYAAGKRRLDRDQTRAEVRNFRTTTLAAAIMAAAMQGNWGRTVEGKHKKYNLEELEDMAVKSAERMASRMKVFE